MAAGRVVLTTTPLPIEVMVVGGIINNVFVVSGAPGELGVMTKRVVEAIIVDVGLSLVVVELSTVEEDEVSEEISMIVVVEGVIEIVEEVEEVDKVSDVPEVSEVVVVGKREGDENVESVDSLVEEVVSGIETVEFDTREEIVEFVGIVVTG